MSSKCLSVKVELMLVSWSHWEQYSHLKQEGIFCWDFFCFSKTRKKIIITILPAGAVSAIVRSSSKTRLSIPSQAIFQPCNVISWSLTFDTPNSVVRELGHSSFPRNWGPKKSLAEVTKCPNLTGRTEVPILNPQFFSIVLVLVRCCLGMAPVLWIPWIFHGLCALLSLYNWVVDTYEVYSIFSPSRHSSAHCGMALSPTLPSNCSIGRHPDLLIAKYNERFSGFTSVLILTVLNTSYLKHILSLPTAVSTLVWFSYLSGCFFSISVSFAHPLNIGVPWGSILSTLPFDFAHSVCATSATPLAAVITCLWVLSA